MKIIEYKFGDALPNMPKTSVALGFFDGMHLAHRHIISTTVAEAKQRGLCPAVFTFPVECELIKSSAPRIYTSEERAQIMEELGVEILVNADFASVCRLSPSDFVTRVLSDDLNCRLAVCGYNYRFGSKAAGDGLLLSSIMHSLGRDALVVEEKTLGGKTISSSSIRESLAKGLVADAAKALGAPYFIEGAVEHGRGDGKRFGIPTANLTLPDGCPLASGVYLTAVVIDGEGYTALTNVGRCPTFGAREVHAETTILNYSKDIYGKNLRIYFIDKIRDERVFSGKDELVQRIEEDKRIAEIKGENIRWQEIGLK